jgi:2-polyprenyl-3-methyl-5-hydroxy-6-metoxy-1,4-benzoquinol methylase
MEVTLTDQDGSVHISHSGKGERTISVDLTEPEVPKCICKTSYDIELIKRIIDVKGLRSLCDEVKKDENPSNIQDYLKYTLFSYVSENSIHGKRILDFGCGSGSPTMVLARMFPDAKIVGVDIDEDSLSIARLRSQHYKFDNVTFLHSPNSNDLPFWPGNFDYAILNKVYEHFLPNERKTLLLEIWSHIKPDGILFINDIPHRYFPVENHVTGLPLINYLSDKMTLKLARKYSKRVGSDETFEDLLRRGIRGATVKEISNILNTDSSKPIFMEPTRLQMKDNIDLWFQLSKTSRFPILKKCFRSCSKILKTVTGITFMPYLHLAIKKPYLEEVGSQ